MSESYAHEWVAYTVDEIVSRYIDFRGRTPLKLGMEWGGGDIRALSANNVQMGKINFDKECYFGSESLYARWMTKGDCSRGDIAFTTEAPLGNVAQIQDDKKYILSQRTILFKLCTNTAFSDYIYQLLRSEPFQAELVKNSTGSTVVGIQQKKLAKIKVILPPLPAQRKIAKILSTVDNLIEKTKALIDKYQSIKQGMMHDLFTRGVDESGKLRPSYEEAPHLYKESELGWIPKELEVAELADYLSYISYGFTNPMPETSEGPWMVTAANVQMGHVDYLTCRHTSQEAFDYSLTNKSRPVIGDVLLTKDGTLGRVAVVDREGICINQSVAVLRPNDRIAVEFLSKLLQSPFYQAAMHNDAGGSTIKHIYITVVDKMLVAIPKALEEQQCVTRIVSSLERKITLEEEYLAKLNKQKSGLMQDLLTGNVRVEVADEMREEVH